MLNDIFPEICYLQVAATESLAKWAEVSLRGKFWQLYRVLQLKWQTFGEILFNIKCSECYALWYETCLTSQFGIWKSRYLVANDNPMEVIFILITTAIPTLSDCQTSVFFILGALPNNMVCIRIGSLFSYPDPPWLPVYYCTLNLTTLWQFCFLLV